VEFPVLRCCLIPPREGAWGVQVAHPSRRRARWRRRVDHLLSVGLRQGQRPKSAIWEVDVGHRNGPHARQRRRPSPLPRRRALRLARLPRLIG
jgi:hypothetical protein